MLCCNSCSNHKTVGETWYNHMGKVWFWPWNCKSQIPIHWAPFFFWPKFLFFLIQAGSCMETNFCYSLIFVWHSLIRAPICLHWTETPFNSFAFIGAALSYFGTSLEPKSNYLCSKYKCLWSSCKFTILHALTCEMSLQQCLIFMPTKKKKT